MEKVISSVSVVVPFYNSENLLSSLLGGIFSQTYPKNSLEVIIVAIDSTLKKEFGRAVKVVEVAKRIGYGEAANIGIKKAKGDYILLLNVDLRLEQTMLSELMMCIKQQAGQSIVGPKMFSMDQQDVISSYDIPGMGFNPYLGRVGRVSVVSIEAKREPFEVDWLSGSVMLFPKELWYNLGGFDNRFFLYWEDADFCMRAKKQGYKVFLIPTVKAWHTGSAVVGKETSEKTYYLVRNSRLFIAKHAFFTGKMILNLANILGILTKAITLLLPQQRRESLAFIRGIIDFHRKKWGRGSGL